MVVHMNQNVPFREKPRDEAYFSTSTIIFSDAGRISSEAFAGARHGMAINLNNALKTRKKKKTGRKIKHHRLHAVLQHNQKQQRKMTEMRAPGGRGGGDPALPREAETKGGGRGRRRGGGIDSKA